MDQHHRFISHRLYQHQLRMWPSRPALMARHYWDEVERVLADRKRLLAEKKARAR